MPWLKTLQGRTIVGHGVEGGLADQKGMIMMKRSSRLVQRLRLRWLNFMYRRWLLLSTGLTLLLGLGIRFVIHLFNYDPVGPAEVGVNLIVATFSLTLPVLLTIGAIFPQVRKLMNMLGSAEETGRETITMLVDEELTSLVATVTKMRKSGAELDPVEVAKWIRRCFASATGKAAKYIGTDSNVPSRYRLLYGDYLRSQEGFLEESGELCGRILISDTAAIREDQSNHPEDSEWFFSWHQEWKNDLRLLRVDPQDARQIANQYGLDTTDVGFWAGNYALFFDPSSPGEEANVRLRIAFPGEDEYNKCRRYVERLVKEGSDASREVPWFTGPLADAWENFIMPEARLRTESGFLLDRVLSRFSEAPNSVRILDAAMGIGVETVFLLNKGFYVVGNEVEEPLRQKAAKYASAKGLVLPKGQITRENWLRLDKSFFEHAFNVVLVIGNSLCLLANSAEVLAALKQFQRLISPGGVLVVDERNFQYILDSWDSIIRDPWKNFRYTRKFVYCGSEVMGVPTDRLDGRVVFTYANVERKRPVKELGHLSMYPFTKGKLASLLKEAGFSTISTYSDVTGPPVQEYDPNADFFTYIAEK